MKEGKTAKDASAARKSTSTGAHHPIPQVTSAPQATPITGTSSSNGAGAKSVGVKKDGGDGVVKRKPRDDPEPPFKPKVTLPYNMEPTYFIGGGNGVNLLDETLMGLGWRRTKDKSDDNYKLKWTELKTQINYNKFREGEQMVNHIPNCNLLTNKLGLLNTLQDHERACSQRGRGPKLDFIPETFRLDDAKDRETFLDSWQDGDVWICKPTGKNQGKGIFLVRNQDDVKQMIQEQESKKEDGRPVKPLNRVIQRYIHNPLLIDGKKFDMRCYMLVASCVPYLVLYHPGYVRLSMMDYDHDSDNLIAHLTNQFIQKKDPGYQDNKEETVWSWDKFNTYLNEHVAEEKGIPVDWLHSVFDARAKAILQYTFNSVKHKLARRLGYFDLYGIDFMIDEDMKVWLIEVNVNPTLATNCEALKECIPPIVKETIYTVVECFEKSRKNRPILPLTSQRRFEIIHNGCGKPRSQGPSPYRGYNTREKRSYSASPVRRYQMPESSQSRAPFAKNTLRATATFQDVSASSSAAKSAARTHPQRSGVGASAPKSEVTVKSSKESTIKGADTTTTTTTKSEATNKDSKETKDEDTTKDTKDNKDTKDGKGKKPETVRARKEEESNDVEVKDKDKSGTAKDTTKGKPVVLSLSKVQYGVNANGRSFGGTKATGRLEKKDQPLSKVDKKDTSPKPEKKADPKGKTDTKDDKRLTTKETEKDKKEAKDTKGKQETKSPDTVDKSKNDNVKHPKDSNNKGKEDSKIAKDTKAVKEDKSKDPKVATAKDIKKEKTDVSRELKTDIKKEKTADHKSEKSDIKSEKSDVSAKSKKSLPDKTKQPVKPTRLAETETTNTNTNNSKSQGNTSELQIPKEPPTKMHANTSKDKQLDEEDAAKLAEAGASTEAPRPEIIFAPPNLTEAEKKALRLDLKSPKPKLITKCTKSPYVATKPASVKLRMSHGHTRSSSKNSEVKQTDVNRGS